MSTVTVIYKEIKHHHFLSPIYYLLHYIPALCFLFEHSQALMSVCIACAFAYLYKHAFVLTGSIIGTGPGYATVAWHSFHHYLHLLVRRDISAVVLDFHLPKREANKKRSLTFLLWVVSQWSFMSGICYMEAELCNISPNWCWQLAQCWHINTYFNSKVTVASHRGLKLIVDIWHWGTCSPDILSLDALVKLKVRQFINMPAVTVHMDTPWMCSAWKKHHHSHSQTPADALKIPSVIQKQVFLTSNAL